MVIGEGKWKKIQDKLEKHNRAECDRFWNSVVNAALDVEVVR